VGRAAALENGMKILVSSCMASLTIIVAMFLAYSI
jgi:hypothetical protein